MGGTTEATRHHCAGKHTQLTAVGLSSAATSVLQGQAHLVGTHGAGVVQVELPEDALQGEAGPQVASDATVPIIFHGDS